MKQLHERALARADQIGALQTRVIKRLKSASRRLTAFSQNYEQAYKGFAGTLKEADKTAQSAADALNTILGIAVGAVIGAVNPAALVLRVAFKTAAQEVAQAAKKSLKVWAATTAKTAAKETVGEGLEAIAAAATQVSASSPSDTAQLGGQDVAAQYKRVLGLLTGLIDKFPDFMPLQGTQTALARLVTAAGVSDEPRLWRALTSLDDLCAAAIETLSASLLEPFDNLERVIDAQPLKSAPDLEVDLWLEWASKLPAPYTPLKFKVVQDRLEAVGLRRLFKGVYSAMEDVDRLALNAKVAWLNAHGISVDPNSRRLKEHAGSINQLVKLGQGLSFLEQNVALGRRGTFVRQSDYEGSVLIDGKAYPFAGQVPPAAETGTEVIVARLSPSWERLASLAEKAFSAEPSDVADILPYLTAGLQVKWDMYRDTPPFEYP